MEELRFEERHSLLDPIHFFNINKRKDFDRRGADRSGVDLSVKPYIKDDLADPSIQSSFKRIQKTVINSVLKFLKNIRTAMNSKY